LGDSLLKTLKYIIAPIFILAILMLSSCSSNHVSLTSSNSQITLKQAETIINVKYAQFKADNIALVDSPTEVVDPAADLKGDFWRGEIWQQPLTSLGNGELLYIVYIDVNNGNIYEQWVAFVGDNIGILPITNITLVRQTDSENTASEKYSEDYLNKSLKLNPKTDGVTYYRMIFRNGEYYYVCRRNVNSKVIFYTLNKKTNQISIWNPTY
jgi:hypothetical protein